MKITTSSKKSTRYYACTNMKLFLLFFLVPVLTALLTAATPETPKNEKPEEPIIETIQVENIEVPVRVFNKSEMVKGLTKDDFQLFVNGEKKEINGFYSICSRLAVTTPTTGENGQKNENQNTHPTPTQVEPRLFVLIFNISDANQELKSAMDIFFNSVIRPKDRLMIISNHFFISEWSVQNPANAKQKTLDIIARQKVKLRPEMAWFSNELRAIAATLKSNLESEKQLMSQGKAPSDDKFPAGIFEEFFLNYRFVLEDIRSQYLSLPVSRYIRIANYLKSQRIKKWVFNFYQIGQLPMLDQSGQIGREVEYYSNASGSGKAGGGPFSGGSQPNASAAAMKIRTMLMKLQNDLNSYDDLMNKDIGKAFLNSGATFHTMLLKPLNPTFSADYNYQAFSTDTEIILRNLSQLTGGTIMKTNDMKKFVEHFSQKEDVLYMLTYVPDGGQKKDSPKRKRPRVKVKLKNQSSKYRLVFDDQKREYSFRAAERRLNQADPDIVIEKMVYKDEQLTVKLKNIKMVENQGEIYGAVRARIKILNEEAKVLKDYEKSFKGIDETGVFKAELSGLSNGRYNIVLEVKDLFSLKNTVVGEAISIVKQ